MSILPSVRANLEERFIFNFRLPVEVLASYLPARWLSPQVINGFGVVSFCLLDLRNITVAPLPTMAGLASISCAPRFAVEDRSGGGMVPAVFVTERQTNSAFGSWFTSLGFSAPHPHVDVRITRDRGVASLSVSDGEPLFTASVRAGGPAGSALFESEEAFAAFIAQGVTSYGLSRHEGRLTKMDLHKADGFYETLRVDEIGGPLVEAWQAGGGVLDSAYRTSGGRYEWEYFGLVDVADGRAI